MSKQQIVLIGLFVLFALGGFMLGTQRDLILLLASQSSESVSPRQLAAMLQKKNFTFINVHTPYEGEIEKTDTFIAFDQIVANSSILPADKTTPIILYCKSGRMSSEALETIKKLGYTNVKHLAGGMDAWKKSGKSLVDLSTLENDVLPKEGVELPIAWGDIGPQLVKLGVIDLEKFRQAAKPTTAQEDILTKKTGEKIRIDAINAQFVVDMLWAVGLAQKSTVYEEGPMGKEYKKDVGNFASTGGWTLARGNATQYLNRFDLIPLTDQQQKKVAEVAQNVYRPCCGNSTWFPDCNHGMAALAIIELLVANNVDEQTIYRKVLGFNSFWFPDSYLYVATYFARQGTSWDRVDAKIALSEGYSSAKGAADIAKKVGSLPFRPASGGSCGT